MKCLSCGLETESDKISYHVLCARRLFGTETPPKINFSSEEIVIEAKKILGKMSISGVQEKLSVRLDKKNNCLEVTAQNGTHILKPSPAHYPHLAENENFCMNFAANFSIEMPMHGLLPFSDGKLVYIVRRFDRIQTKENFSKLHVEDFAQLLGKDDKYKGSVEQIGRFLMHNSHNPFIDTQKFFVRVLFNFLIGNGDAHLKNFSMISDQDNHYRLAPAYDLVSSRLALPNETDEMALSIGGKKKNIRLNLFKNFALYLEMNQKQLDHHLFDIKSFDALLQRDLPQSFLPQEMRAKLLDIAEKRYRRLFEE